MRRDEQRAPVALGHGTHSHGEGARECERARARESGEGRARRMSKQASKQAGVRWSDDDALQKSGRAEDSTEGLAVSPMGGRLEQLIHDPPATKNHPAHCLSAAVQRNVSSSRARSAAVRLARVCMRSR